MNGYSRLNMQRIGLTRNREAAHQPKAKKTGAASVPHQKPNCNNKKSLAVGALQQNNRGPHLRWITDGFIAVE
jgi:hypothetical protein